MIISQKNWKLDNEENRKKIIEVIIENKIELIVIDSFVRIHAAEEKEAKESAVLYSYFKEIMIATGAGIIMTHHNRKLKEHERINLDVVRGSGDIVAFAEAILVLQSRPLKGKENIVIRCGIEIPFPGSPSPFPAGGFGDFEVAQLVRAMD